MMRFRLIETASIDNRNAAIDLLRGLAMLVLIIETFLVNYQLLPRWLWHAQWNGLGLADLGVPIFLLAMGMSYELSFQKRIQQCSKIALIVHFLKRYLLLFVFGLGGTILALGHWQWEILQVIGAVGIYTLLFMFLRPIVRLLLAMVLAIVYQLTILDGAYQWVYAFAKSGLGGPYATLSWGFIVIFGSVLMHYLSKQRKQQQTKSLILIILLLLIISWFLNLWIPFNKHLVSLSYLVFGGAVACLGFVIFLEIADKWSKPLTVFSSLGKNPLVCYILSQLLIFLVSKLLPSNTKVLWLLSIGLTIVVICISLAYFLDTKRAYIRL